ncbi:MAG: clostripain-related cysteine peptidase [Candidatus Methanofastidiosia archaeon]
MNRRKKMYSKKLTIVAPLLVCILISVAPCPLHATACWTVMVYMDGDNYLEPSAIDDLNEMEAVGSTSKVNIVVQIDRHDAYDNSNGDWDTAKRYHVTSDTNGYDTLITSEMVGDLGEVNMGDPNTLIAFVQWAQTNYTADHYLLVLWDHGSGWKAVPGPIRAVCVDDTDNDELSLSEVRMALSSITCSGDCPLDIVGFDACFMGMVEVDHEILPFAHYAVGSEEYEPGDGWDYVGFLSYLVSTPEASLEAVCTKVVETYINFYGKLGPETQSAAHLNPTSTVVEALDIFAQHLAGAKGYEALIQTARTHAEAFSDLDYIDLYHFAQLIASSVPHPALQRDAAQVMRAINDAVIAEGHGYGNRNARGMSIYFPLTSAGYKSRYETSTALAENTFWDEFLRQYYSANYPLSATLVGEPDLAYSGDTVTVKMEVTNLSAATTTAVTPSPLTVITMGTASAVLSSGPTPVKADLASSQSVVFVWEYQVFSGNTGGTIIFSGNAHGIDSVSSETVFSPLAVSNKVTIPGPAQLINKPTDYNQQIQSLANNRIQEARSMLESLNQQFASLESEGKDTTPCEELLEQVEEYLRLAEENYQRGNYIAANYWALQATAAMEKAEKCLDEL